MDDHIILPLHMAAQREETISKTFQKEKKRLLGFIRQRISNEEDAEDVLSDVFHQFIETFNLQPIEKISSWLYRVARNKIVDRYRKKKPEAFSTLVRTSEEDDDVSAPFLALLTDSNDNVDNVYLRSMVWEALTGALEDLPTEQKEVFVWHEIEGRDFKEISAMTGESVNTLLSRKRYAVLYLREQLRVLYDDLIKN